MERAGARVSGLATRQRDLEEALPFNREVQRVVRRLQVAGLEVARGGDRTRAEPGFEANRRLRLLRGRRPGSLELLVDEVLELDTALLEAGRVHVGQVVRDVIDVRLLRVHPARRRIQRSNHDVVSVSTLGLLCRLFVSPGTATKRLGPRGPRKSFTTKVTKVTKPFLIFPSCLRVLRG